MSEWIRIEDEFPPKDTRVLCYHGNEYMNVLEYWYDEDGKHMFFNPPIANIGDVTHWMPLPNPPSVFVDKEEHENKGDEF
jgi:hypothetical protein